MNTQELSKYQTSMYNPRGVAIGDDARVYYVENQHVNAPPPPASREKLLEAIHSASGQLRDYPSKIADIHLERAEVAKIVEWVQNAEPKKSLGLLGMLLDKPGGGKTVVMRDVQVELEAASMPVLAIKADTLSDIKNRTDLADRLGLPASVEECAGVLASEGLFFVLLDQLDALSLTLSRDQSTLNVMLSTLSRLRTIPNVRLLASCRTFDLKNDPHLSTLKVDRKFDLRPLDNEQVNRVLHAIGINPAHLLPAHRTLLATPLHLDIYARIIRTETPKSVPESYYTLQELYEGLWRKRIVAIPPHTPPPRERSQAIYKLVEVMKNRRQPKLTAPLATLDEYSEAAYYLKQVQIIRQEKRNWLFFHQTFFDYCYARHFVAEGGSLSQKILDSSQGLFYRSLMVQVLAYLRGSDEMAYRQEMRQLLFTDDLRTHLRLLLIGWFGQLPNPSAEERRIADRLMKDTDDLKLFLRAIGGNPGWFDLLKGDKLPSLLRADDENRIQVAVGLLSTMKSHRTDDLLALLRPYLGKSEAWDERITYCLSALEAWQDERIVEIFCGLLRRGRTGKRAEGVLYELSKSNLVNACRALRAHLDYGLENLLRQEQMEQQDAKANPNKAFWEDSDNRRNWSDDLLKKHPVGKLVQAAVEYCPDQVLEHLFPWFIETSQRLAEPRDKESYSSDPLFCWSWYGNSIMEGAVFAKNMSKVLQHLARTRPAEFNAMAAELSGINSLAVQRVLAHVYLANPEKYALDIFEYLVADIRRLRIGKSDYDSCLLYRAAFEHVDAERRAILEQLILDLRPEWEQLYPRHRGTTQLPFLKSVPLKLLSQTTRRKRQELERKFPSFELRRPKGITSEIVGPPIPQTALTKMSDEAWLGAMRKYDDATARDAPPENWIDGGIVELSGAFIEQVKKEPERFYHLAQRFDETISPRYIAASISGLAESEAPAEWVFDLVRHFVLRIEGKFRLYVCCALEKRAKDGVPDDLLDLMTDWALNDPDPFQERWRIPASDGRPHYGGDPQEHGINSNRGAAIQTVCYCTLHRQPTQIERAFRLLEQAANDPSTAVRACVITSLGALPKDEFRQLAIFSQTLDGHPHLLQNSWVHEFLYCTYYRHFPRTRPFIEALLTNEDDKTRQAGGRLSCLAAAKYPEASPLVEQVMQGDAAMRCGAAQVYAYNLADPQFEANCKERLLRLMHDPDEQVRIYVSECFEHLHPEHLDHLRPFIEAFIDSPSLFAGAKGLIDYLTPLATEEHDLALLATERILDSMKTTNLSWRGHEVVCLPLAVYNYATDPATKSRAMALFERLLLLGSWAAQQALADWDRR